jgi:hypothetical protein
MVLSSPFLTRMPRAIKSQSVILVILELITAHSALRPSNQTRALCLFVSPMLLGMLQLVPLLGS